VFRTDLCAGSRQKDAPTILFENQTKGENQEKKENIQNRTINLARNSEVRTACGSYGALSQKQQNRGVYSVLDV